MNSEKIKLGLWSGVGGALVTVYVGFNFGGWVTNGGAVAMAKETAATAVAERLGTICVAQFNGDKAKSEKLVQMKGKDAWELAVTSTRKLGRSCRVRRSPKAALPTPVPSSWRRQA